MMILIKCVLIEQKIRKYESPQKWIVQLLHIKLNISRLHAAKVIATSLGELIKSKFSSGV